MRKIIILIGLLFSLPYTCPAQDLDYDLLENILEKISDETGSSPEFDAIEQLIEYPIYLKQTSIQEFLQIPGFTTSEAKAILEITGLDTITNYQQLFIIIKLSDEQKYLLQICTSLEKPLYLAEKNKFYWRTRVKDYLIEPRGFTQNKFKGDALDLYNRFTGYCDGFSLGILTDKDAGELYLADNYSGYFSGELSGFKFLVGDYYIETGMGNILWKPFAVGKGAEVIYPSLQRGSGIREYRSSIDYRNFRGFALEKSLIVFGNNINVLVWYSNVNRTGTIEDSGRAIEAVYRAGYYRTESEISKKNAFNEVLLGSNLEWKNDFLSAGFTAMHLRYDKPILSESKYAFYGKEGNMLSVYSFFNYSNFSIGAELSSDANGNAGIKTGSQIEFGDFELAMNFRSFTPDFRSQYGYSFGESTAPNNEYGLYTGLRYKGIEDFIFSTYADFYASYERTYYVPEPIHGDDLFFQTDWKMSDDVSTMLRFSAENKTDAINISDSFKEVYQKAIYRLRVELNAQLLKSLSVRFRTEADYVSFKNIIENERGIAGFLELKWLPFEFMQTGCRFSAFSTNSFESVVYQYEMAVPGYMTSVPLYGDGYRALTFIKISPVPNIDIWLRYSITKKNNVSSIGSGYLEIFGKKDERIIIQLDCRL
ncbi:MAG: hypothetical protein V1779_17115 [bacterium]